MASIHHSRDSVPVLRGAPTASAFMLHANGGTDDSKINGTAEHREAAGGDLVAGASHFVCGQGITQAAHTRCVARVPGAWGPGALSIHVCV